MKAVHFGAGNIGRGFVGLILHEASYELVFADVNAELIESLAAAPSYAVHEVGLESATRTVDNFRALNSSTQATELVAEIASADIVTTAVGPGILRFIAPHIIEGLRLRLADAAPLQVMACENAINATDMLRDAMEALVEPREWTELAPRAIFANTAVDRIVPGQDPAAGLDVTVETFFEWVIERAPFGDAVPAIAAANFVDDLEPYIERKLFTVNTGHATVAYLGFVAGFERLDDALGDPRVVAGARLVLEETSALLVQKHGLDPEAQRAYREKILVRFANPHLPDTVARVGRQPVRKLSRHERFIGPAAEAAENGLPVDGLLAAIGAALRFDVPSDEQSVELQRLLETESAASITESLCGIEVTHPLFERLRAVIETRQLL